MTHQVVKPEKIAAAAATLLEQSLVVPAVFRREGIEQFKGAKNDAINVKVEGVLPFRTYGWRNDRSTEIQFDEYAEKTVQITFGDDIYSAVMLTDEQNDFDLNGWAKLVSKQTDALARGLEYKATDYLRDAPYEITLKLDEADLRSGLIRARSVMNRLLVQGARTILIGTDVEAALLSDDKLNLAVNVGDAQAVSALTEATIGRRYGFQFVVAPELPPTQAVAMVDSAFVFATGAPSVPQSVGFGATASSNGVAVRWMRDYEMTRTRDRSLVNTYQGFREVKDELVGRDQATGQAFVSTSEHFVRAIKLELGGADVLPPATGGTAQEAELRAITGIHAAA